MNFTIKRWAFWAMAVAATVVFALGMSLRYENWLILGIGVPLAVMVAVALQILSDYEGKSAHQDGASDE